MRLSITMVQCVFSKLEWNNKIVLDIFVVRRSLALALHAKSLTWPWCRRLGPWRCLWTRVFWPRLHLCISLPINCCIPHWLVTLMSALLITL